MKRLQNVGDLSVEYEVGPEIRTAIRWASILAILFAGDPDLIDAVIRWIG